MPYLTVDSAIDADFVESITKMYGLERLRAGRHVLRDARGWKAGEMTVDALWVAEIQPSFKGHGCLAMLTVDKGQSASFCVRRGGIIIPIGPVNGEWADTVAQALQYFDAWSARREIRIDGIAYSIFLDTSDVQLAVNFANPRTSSLMALERAFLQVAQLLSTNDSGGIIKEYLHDWIPYTASRPQS